MPRSVNHVASRARRKKILGLTKGYFGARKNVWTVAKNTWEKGLTYAYRDRKNKKRNFRALWIQRINAASCLLFLTNKFCYTLVYIIKRTYICHTERDEKRAALVGLGNSSN